IETPLVAAGVEGTEFVLGVSEAGAELWVFEGQVRYSNPQGQLEVRSGEGALARPGQAPERRVVVKPREAVEWALYYPPLVDPRPESYPPALRATLPAYRANDLPVAFAALDRVPARDRDGRYLLLRAGLLLSVGRVAKAEADLAEAERADPKSGGASALRSVIALVRDQKDEALRLAETGAGLDPNSPLPQAALSYAHQGRFEIEKALEHAKRAVELAPEDALVWARLAELELSRGDLDAALGAATKAETLDPDLARTETVLGFAYLTRIEVDEARAAFDRAIARDPADPLPRLGLGLAKIRDGDLDAGTEEIEIVASLDPNNSLVRSYLGKAYYEQKRSGLAETEYEQAKLLDPKDPTPWFYDAIEKQTTNRAVEALHDLQRSIELNNNRAVYRSKLLLDQDLAARSASLGRIYNDLGFQQLGLVEGWKSVNTDPGNYSAHRLLADNYAALPRHEIARVSELLKSQLLQPLNMTPIQPRLAESNLFLISAGGPGGLSFNEFNPLFNRDGVTLQTSGLVGERNTYAGEGVVSGIYGNAAFSVGGFHSTSDGFRNNDDHKDDIGNAFVQFELSPQTSIQAEYRYRSIEQGDLLRSFFRDDFFPNERNDEERHTYRLGARHSFSEASTLLGSFIYQNADFGFRNNLDAGLPELISFSEKRPETAVGFEIQHLFRSQYINLTAGVGHSDISGRLDKQVVGFPPPLAVLNTTDRISKDLKHTNAYAYSYLNPLKNVTLTLGVSGDFTGGESLDVAGINQINPKFGIMWEPVAGTTLRTAAFRSLKRTLITNQTLEPTQVAGFNQFFDDFNGTKAWRYGVAIDQKFSSTLFGGAEISRRDLGGGTINTVDESSFLTRFDSQENLARAYLFWTPRSWLALRAEYQFERINSDEIDALVRKMDTQRVPLGFSVFLPSGWSAAVTATYHNQDGVFLHKLTQEFEPAHDNFWPVDAGLSYRLPKRYGFITVGASNLFDEEFNFFDTDVNNPRIHSGRMVFGRVTLALP
ncbi:MAG: tetratricopeptide repeat protein, partial [Acidimicrobiia bacterium]